MPKDTINSYTIRSGGNFTIDSTNGEIKSIPTSYTFGNDISHGEIDNSIKRVQHLSRVEHIKTNHNMTVDGTSQNSTGGIWNDVGSPSLHSGHAQRAATSLNKELYALISNYPDRDDGKPLFSPFPNITECLKEARQITAQQTEPNLPTIKSIQDISLWITAYTSNLVQQNTKNISLQMETAGKLVIEKQQKQIERQKEFLVNKFGEEMYELIYKKQVEAGAIFDKDYNDYSITTNDVHQAAFDKDKSDKRNAFAAKIG